eukprot:7728-Heterococcus_DN1.PRE.2
MRAAARKAWPSVTRATRTLSFHGIVFCSLGFSSSSSEIAVSQSAAEPIVSRPRPGSKDISAVSSKQREANTAAW